MGWVDDFCSNPKWDANQFSDLSLTGETPCFESIVLSGSVQLAFLILVPLRLFAVRFVVVAPHSGGDVCSADMFALRRVVCGACSFVASRLWQRRWYLPVFTGSR